MSTKAQPNEQDIATAYAEVIDHISTTIVPKGYPGPIAFDVYRWGEAATGDVQLKDVILAGGRRLSGTNMQLLQRLRDDCHQPLNDVAVTFPQDRRTRIEIP